MEIKTDDTHKKIDLRNIDLSKGKKLSVRIGALALAITMLSGCGIKKPKNEDSSLNTAQASSYTETEEEIPVSQKTYDIPEHDDKDEVTIPSNCSLYKDDKEIIKEKYTYEDLKNVDYLRINLNHDLDGSYDFINYMSNLKKLNIIGVSEKTVFDNIDGSRLPSGISISIFDNHFTGAPFNEEKYPFLKDIPSIDRLELFGSLSYDSKYIQSLKNVHNLNLELTYNSNFKYNDLSHLDSLILGGNLYDISMYLTNEDLNEIEKSGVKVLSNDLEIDELKEINERLNNIVSSFDVSSDMSDKEKLLKVIEYVVKKCDYDPDVRTYIETTHNTEGIDYDQFYKEGHMFGVFESDTQICGNYAALTYALGQRAGLDVYNLASPTHAWNAVKIDDDYYYVDSTWLDDNVIIRMEPVKTSKGNYKYEKHITTVESMFDAGDYEEVEKQKWFLEDPTEVDAEENSENVESHVLSFVPEGVEFKEIPDEIDNTSVDISDETHKEEVMNERVDDFTNKKFKITLKNKKTFIVSGAALIGILSGLGIAVHVKNKKERKRLEEIRKNSMQNNYPSFSGDNGNYNDFSNYRRF